MIKTFRIVVILLISVYILGCVSTEKIPTSNYIEPHVSDSAIVYFYRDKTMPKLVNLDVKVDGKKIAALPPDTFTWIKIEKGNHFISVGYPAVFDMDAKAELTVEDGKIYIYKYISSSGGKMMPVMDSGTVVGVVPTGDAPWTRLILEESERLNEIISKYRYVDTKVEK